MQKSVYTRPATVIIRKACWKGKPLAGICELGFQEGSHHSLTGKSGQLPKLVVQKMWFMLNNCFPSGNLEFRHMLRRGCLSDHPPVKILGTESIFYFLFYIFFIVVRTFNMRSTLLTRFLVHNTVFSTIATMLYSRSQELIHFVIETICPLNSNSPFPLPPAPGNLHSTLFL